MFEYLCNTKSDINEHLPTLRDLAKECKHVTEMGMRTGVSTWAFIEGMEGGKLVSIDIKTPEEYGSSLEPIKVACKSKRIDYTFLKESTLNIEIEETDLLFIDTLHEYYQLQQELRLHSDKARKYIVMHDPISCPDMWKAGEEFLAKSKKWKMKELYTNNNGLCVLERC